ncbi:unnamed protein product, partial [Meganyctiphanes norvegica]
AQFQSNLAGSPAAPASPRPPIMKPAMAPPAGGPVGPPPPHPGGYGPCPPGPGPQQCGGYCPPPPRQQPPFGQTANAPPCGYPPAAAPPCGYPPAAAPPCGYPPANAQPCAYQPPPPPQHSQTHAPQSPYGQAPIPNRFFPDMGRVCYRPDAGPEDTLVFRHYNPSEVVHGRTMEDWLRFSPCYFSLFRYFGGEGHMGDRTHIRPWDEGYSWTQRHSKKNYFDNMPYFDKSYPSEVGKGYMEKGYVAPCNQYQDSYLTGPQPPECSTKTFENYKRCMLAAFEFFKKLGVKWYSACDRDFAPEGENWVETNNLLEEATDMALNLQREMGMRPLYFAADLFSHPRYMNGASTNPDAHVYAYACAQVKRAMDMAKKLEAEHFVFFNPRDGYQNSVQRQLYRDMEHLGSLYRMAVQYRDKIGYKGHLLIQPKPFDPQRYQYECDAMATMHMLKHFGLARHYKLYIKPAWSRMMGRPYYHDVYLASAWNMLGMVDASDSYPEVTATTEICARNVRDASYVMKRYLEM